jgi:hypothetical protein
VIGKQVFEKSLNNNLEEINMTGFADGVYFMKVFAGDVSTTIKVVKN